MISSIVWGCLGLCLAVAEVIYAISHVHIFFNSMGIVIIVMCVGLSFIVSAFLQWHKKKAVKIAIGRIHKGEYRIVREDLSSAEEVQD